MFYRLLAKENNMYHSAKYGRVSKRNSYTIAFADENQTLMFGQIQHFTILSGNCVAVVKLFSIPDNSGDHSQLTFSSLNSCLFPVHLSSVIKLVPANMIKEKCIFINLTYVARLTSQITLD